MIVFLAIVGWCVVSVLGVWCLYLTGRLRELDSSLDQLWFLFDFHEENGGHAPARPDMEEAP